MIHICVMSSHKPIRIYMGGLILGGNTLYRLFCVFKLFPMVGKGIYSKNNNCGASFHSFSNINVLLQCLGVLIKKGCRSVAIQMSRCI